MCAGYVSSSGGCVRPSTLPSPSVIFLFFFVQRQIDQQVRIRTRAAKRTTLPQKAAAFVQKQSPPRRPVLLSSVIATTCYHAPILSQV